MCCRDPNYVDPWPNMNGGNKNMNNGGNGNGNISPRRNQQNGNGNLGVQPARNQQNNGNGMYSIEKNKICLQIQNLTLVSCLFTFLFIYLFTVLFVCLFFSSTTK